MRNQNEYYDQCAVIVWAQTHEHKWPELAGLFAIPNGLQMSIGLRVKANKQGIKGGVPDLMLAVARGIYHGLFIEMKDFGKKPSDVQLKWHSYLLGQGYQVKVCYGHLQAIDVLRDYITLTA